MCRNTTRASQQMRVYLCAPISEWLANAQTEPSTRQPPKHSPTAKCKQIKILQIFAYAFTQACGQCVQIK